MKTSLRAMLSSVGLLFISAVLYGSSTMASSSASNLSATAGNAAVTSDTGTSLTNCITYYYDDSALDSAGKGANSTQVCTPKITIPAVPVGLAATAGNAQVIDLVGASRREQVQRDNYES